MPECKGEILPHLRWSHSTLASTIGIPLPKWKFEENLDENQLAMKQTQERIVGWRDHVYHSLPSQNELYKSYCNFTQDGEVGIGSWEWDMEVEPLNWNQTTIKLNPFSPFQTPVNDDFQAATNLDSRSSGK